MAKSTSKGTPKSTAKSTAKKTASTKGEATPRRRGRPPKRRPPPEAAASTTTTRGAHVITRYGNRRLYDHVVRHAVTLDDVARLTRAGEPVQIVDGDTGRDITSRVLLQILFDEQGSYFDMLPATFVRMLFSLRDEKLIGWMQQYLGAGVDWLTWQRRGAPATARAAIEEVFEKFGGVPPWAWDYGPKPGDEFVNDTPENRGSQIPTRAELEAMWKNMSPRRRKH